MTRVKHVFRDGEWAPLGEEPPTLGRLATKETINGFRTRQLPRWYPYANKYDKDGTVIVSGKREAKEIAARARDAGENLKYDY